MRSSTFLRAISLGVGLIACAAFVSACGATASPDDTEPLTNAPPRTDERVAAANPAGSSLQPTGPRVADDEIAEPLFGPPDVLETRASVANPFAVAPAAAGEPLIERHYGAERLPRAWQDGEDSLADPAGAPADGQSWAIGPTSHEDRGRQLLALLRATLGDAAWNRPGVWLECDATGATIRQTRAALDQIDAVLAALAAGTTRPMVTVTMQMMAVPPGAMSAFRTVSPLPGVEPDRRAAGPPHALLARTAASTFLDMVRTHDPETPVSNPSILQMAGQAATIGLYTKRSYVRGHDAVEGAPAGTFDPVVGHDARGLVASLRPIPLAQSRGHLLVLHLEVASRVPMLRYPLNGGGLSAQIPPGGRVTASGCAVIPPGMTLLVVVPESVSGDDAEDRMLLLMFTVQAADVDDR